MVDNDSGTLESLARPPNSRVSLAPVKTSRDISGSNESSTRLENDRDSFVIKSAGRPLSLIHDRHNLDLYNTQSKEDLRSLHATNIAPIKIQESRKLLTHLELKPGDSGFLLWYYASNFFPMVAASIGPISNLNSVASLSEPWRINLSDGTRIGDFKWVLGVNAISLFLGCASNVSLLLNFSGRVDYAHAQFVSIVGWYFACVSLVGLLVSTQYLYFQDSSISKSEGYWHGIFTAILYFVSASSLLVNWIGHRRNKYPATFNLTTAQRRIMFQNLLFILWIGFGALLFTYLDDLHYPDAVYYCVVTVTTIGLGDILPKTTVARALVLPYALVGVIYLGLIVTSITSVVMSSNSAAVVYDRAERARVHVYERLIRQQQEENPISPKESYLLSRKIHRRALRRGKLRALCFSLLLFSIFWLLGALAFYLMESNWSYFDGLYLSSLCLLTIGYGDFVPTSSAARAFFIIWAFGAVPTMTVLISNLSDNLFHWINDFGDVTTAWLLAAYSVRLQYFTYWRLRFRQMAKLLSFKAKLDLAVEDDEVAIAQLESDLQELAVADDNAETEDQLEATESTAVTEDTNDMITNGTSDILESNGEEVIAESHLPTSYFDKSRMSSETLEVANIADRVLGIIQEVRGLAAVAAREPRKKFSYEEWQRISRIVTGEAKQEIDFEFWLSAKSPIRFPVSEVRYLLQECLEGIEVGIYDMLEAHKSKRNSGQQLDTILDQEEPESDLSDETREKKEISDASLNAGHTGSSITWEDLPHHER